MVLYFTDEFFVHLGWSSSHDEVFGILSAFIGIISLILKIWHIQALIIKKISISYPTERMSDEQMSHIKVSKCPKQAEQISHLKVSKSRVSKCRMSGWANVGWANVAWATVAWANVMGGEQVSCEQMTGWANVAWASVDQPVSGEQMSPEQLSPEHMSHLLLLCL